MKPDLAIRLAGLGGSSFIISLPLSFGSTKEVRPRPWSLEDDELLEDEKSMSREDPAIVAVVVEVAMGARRSSGGSERQGRGEAR